MHIFYTTNINSNICLLPETESRHCIKVLRLQAGDIINIIDGKGGFFKAEITLAHPKHTEAKIIEKIKNFAKRKSELHIAIAPTKNITRYETFIEKSVEIGIEEITPIFCRFSERKVIKNERLEKVILSAAKQSKKAFLAKLNNAIKFNQFIKQPFEGQKYIAHCYDTHKKELKNILQKNTKALILIGPEGDFSKEEVALAENNGFISVNISNSRLRTETAGIIASAIFDFVN